MRLRVVCGFEVTIAIFCPTSRFTRVDFPAFGRPISATNPERKARFSSLLSASVINASPWTSRGHGSCLRADSDTQDFPLVRLQNLEAVPLQIDLVSWRGNFARNMAQ